MGRPKAKNDMTDQYAAVVKVFGNFDLLTKILNLLPPKQLTKSKAVSNYWLALISHSQFQLNYIRLHRTTHPPSTFSHFYYDNKPISLDGSDEIIPPIHRLEGVRLNAPQTNSLHILNSCNGLLLCKYSSCDWFIVFNPTTKKHRPLPTSGILAHSNERNIVLAFDPLTSFNYKVVCFREGLSRSAKRLNIFSSKSASWKEICLRAPSDGLITPKRVFWNGGIHWINYTNFHVRFDVDEENFTWNKIPIDANTFPEDDNIGYIGECDTGLLLITFPQNGNSLTFGQECSFTILEMKKDSEFWIPKHQVNLEKLLPQMGLSGTRETYTYSVLHVLSESDKDCFSLVLGVLGKIILYSINNRNNQIGTKVLEDSVDGLHNPICGKFFPFIPCLAPV